MSLASSTADPPASASASSPPRPRWHRRPVLLGVSAEPHELSVLVGVAPREVKTRLLESAAAAAALLADPDVDVMLAVLAARMPDGAGLGLAGLVRASHPDAGLLLIAEPDDEPGLLAALRADVDDAVVRPIETDELADAVVRTMRRATARRLQRVRNERLAATCRRLRRLAEHDPLTGLYNRRHLDARLAAEVKRAGRSGLPLSVLLIDLDGFKGLNDARGHEAGDRLLAELGDALRARCRISDVACRYGGDEMAVILPETDRAGALELAEKLRLAVRRELPAEGGSRGDAARVVGASVGVATVLGRGRGESAASLLAAADRALYRAKLAGGDRVMEDRIDG